MEFTHSVNLLSCVLLNSKDEVFYLPEVVLLTAVIVVITCLRGIYVIIYCWCCDSIQSG